VIWRKETTSTMDLANREVEEGACNGTLVIAETQTMGKGTKGRSWSSSPGNLLFTLIFHIPTDQLQKMNIACAASVVHALRKEGLNAKAKWPNDVWIGSKKICGMLAQSASSGKSATVLFGIGINCNQDWRNHPDETLRETGTSLLTLLGKSVSRERVLARFCRELERLYDKPMDVVLNQYKKHELLIGNKILVMPLKEGEKSESAVAVDYNNDGGLQVKYDKGENVTVLHAPEVTIRPESLRDEDKICLIEPPNFVEVISGQWRNQLGSTVKFAAYKDGKISGEYYTSVGNVKVSHPLIGSWTSTIEGDPLMSWVVTWTDITPGSDRSTTVWTGVLLINSDIPPKIISTWLLTSSEDRNDLWKNTLINKDVFIKDAA